MPKIVASAFLVLFGLGTGGFGMGKIKDARIEAMRTEHERQVLAAEREVHAMRVAAREKGNALRLDLENRLRNIREEKDGLEKKIRDRTTGDHCLDASVVRMLDEQNAANRHGPVPQAAEYDALAGWSAAPPRNDGDAYASDRDVANWISLAREKHEECRARLSALIAWHAKEGG
uniref:Uncharacterized protein n=1 Tax=Candidatus Kentrum sp. TC TaxID=2126339 RepID=A0A450YYN1_9GAMM|nr:MAG: hypothetical protein BECKTC1821E_GA0114239_106723 [Candidatus Kentron sp. TC]